MAKRYVGKTTRTPARRERVTFKAKTPEGKKVKVSFLVKRKRK